MTTGFQSYPAYRDADVPWLERIPEHWQLLRGKALFRCIDIRSRTGDEELLTVSSEHGVVPRSSTVVTMFKAESYVGYKLCWPGDLVINSLWAWGRGLGVSRYHGIVSSAYGVYRLRHPNGESSNYIHRLVRSRPFNYELRLRSKGIWISRLQLTDEAFFQAPFPIPPLREQAAIVRFLDHADQRIRRYIRAKQKLIALLEEQKQAVIHEAVTGQIDVRTGRPYPAYKDSGVEWLGDVPEHWDVVRFSRLISDGPKNGVSPPVVEDGSLRSFAISAIRDGDLDVRDGDVKLVSHDGGLVLTAYNLRVGDILLVRGNGNLRLVGRAGLVLEDMPGWLYPDLLMRLRLTNVALPRFVVALLNGPVVRRQVEGAAQTAVGTFKINSRDVRQLWLALPDSREQRDIWAYVSEQTRLSVDLAKQADREIELMKEYRARLIADVVTGKLDVREAAAGLPEVGPLAAEDGPDGGSNPEAGSDSNRFGVNG